MKVKLRHFMHPIVSGKKLVRKAGYIINKKSVDRELENIKRGKRSLCWCGGELKYFKWHKRYSICSVCGSYVNIEPPLPEEMSKIYSFDFYWHFVQKGHGSPAIEERYVNDKMDGRIGFWKSLIEKYKAAPAKVVEIGCAYGGLLKELKNEGYDVMGVEPDEKTAEWTRRNMGIDVRAGFFPGIRLAEADIFLAFDVLEHVPDPQKFLKSAYDLLSPNGIAIIQAPIDRYDYTPPFGERFDMFNDLEHLFLFTDRAMEVMANNAGFEIVGVDRLWLSGEIIILHKKQNESFISNKKSTI